MVILHIVGGLVSLTSGALALFATKGSRLHRRSGMVFVYAMLLMSTSGAVMAALMPEPTSVIAGLLTFYLVMTALLTVRPPAKSWRWVEVLAMIFALVIGLLSIVFVITGNTDGTGPIGLVFGTVALLAAAGDLRKFLGPSMAWTHRIARHLWRMCLALWIATASFFLGQSDELPQALRIMPLLCTPVLLVMLLMFYWLFRVLFTPWRPQSP